MLIGLLRKVLHSQAMKYGRWTKLWLRFCKPNSRDYAEFLRLHGPFHAMGRDCFINLDVKVTDPDYVKLGNNVTLSSCVLLGHDASISVIGRATGKKLDSVGKIDIRDNVFVGYGAILMPGVTIGPNAIIAAGTLVNRDVPQGSVVAGVPARPIATFNEMTEILETRTHQLPWWPIIQKREGDFDPALEPELRRMRIEHFYWSNPGGKSQGV